MCTYAEANSIAKPAYSKESVIFLLAQNYKPKTKHIMYSVYIVEARQYTCFFVGTHWPTDNEDVLPYYLLWRSLLPKMAMLAWLKCTELPAQIKYIISHNILLSHLLSKMHNALIYTCFSIAVDPWKKFCISPLADSNGKQEFDQSGPRLLTTPGRCISPCTLIVM